MKLPDATGLLVACDTEGSGLFADDGARISAVSFAFRDPETGELLSSAVPFDQGLRGAFLPRAGYAEEAPLPLGSKVLPRSHEKRLAKWDFADYAAPNRSAAAWDRLVSWLSRQHLIMANAKHDCLQFLAGQRGRAHGGGLREFETNRPPWDGGWYDLLPSVVWDTMLASGQIWTRDPVGLKATAVRLHLGESIGIPEGGEADEEEALGPWKGPVADPRYDLIPWRILGPYARTDACLTYLLYERQQAEADEQTVIRIEEEIALMRVLTGMERRGVGFDRQGCLAELRKLDKLIAESAALVPFKGGTGRPTPPAAVKYFFGAPAEGGLGLLPYNDKLTATKRPQVDEEVISRLQKLGTPGADEYARFQELSSARSKWYAAFPELAGPDGRLRTTHRQGRVVSGRLSVERWQAQALPHSYQIPDGIEPIRDFLGDDPGFEHWEADASQAEIRVATYVARESNMLRALRKGVDSHDAACKLMFFPDTPLAEAKLTSEWEFLRQIAKRCNLGILYGIGAKGLSIQILKFTGRQVSVPQCAEWITGWKAAFPEFARALYEYSDLATVNGYVRLCTGKVRQFSPYEPVHKAFNQRVQGDVAEAMRIAMVRFDREYPDMLMLQIHDSLVARIPKDRVPEVTDAMQSVMVSTFGRLFSPVPFKTDAKPFGLTACEKAAA